uniref:Tetratricopeptide repeat protein n=1 Tax=Polyblepharides amylifera TaxID=1486889 RepID=A0A7R9XMX9_9CHLO|mmetsp:Transcript_1177/g.1654  ORF Transcript_1177/g.1654 Transcript_1177/m.1654 type:complete len:379 (+) Transcript_1177:83-1219(+)|eukprot:CAMPEP_0196593022 /NCGR_PEP_ID=MMETSP1081-20130531/74414_1 /TAXON_ID=36882 /ORGANISM="Pyramimonas amylifera, Strain CCMP720" /LENGTH=378 /DNA_ID=CAMNT_0041916869 /DNA_START=81 /DNA_END=1217 /DNA_ORIENTATION=+
MTIMFARAALVDTRKVGTSEKASLPATLAENLNSKSRGKFRFIRRRARIFRRDFFFTEKGIKLEVAKENSLPEFDEEQIFRVAPILCSRRNGMALGATIFSTLILDQVQARAEEAEKLIKINLTPDQTMYDPNDSRLRDAARMLQDALQAATVEKEEEGWTQIIVKFQNLDAEWVPDIVGRAYGNRGNARSRQGKFEAALEDYNTAVELCPWSVDPVLNRGVLYENTARLELAERDYRAVLAAAPDDPVGWNNLGNVQMGLGQFELALVSLDRARQLAPEFAFAMVNHSIAQLELGRTNVAIKEMRTTLRRYPDFPEARAALVAALWSDGLEVQAETEWQRVEDPRYSNKSWIRTERRWPPKIRTSLEAFLEFRSIKE